jgi:hypothetical protein
MRLLAIGFALIASVAFAKDGGTARGSSTATSGGTRAGGGGGTMTRGGLGELRPAPPLDPARKVSEQDCSKPIDPQAGNLRCK